VESRPQYVVLQVACLHFINCSDESKVHSNFPALHHELTAVYHSACINAL